MDQIRQNEYYRDTLPSKKNQFPQESEDRKSVSLPHRTYLHSTPETKRQIFSCQDRSKWLAFILQKVRESDLLEKELIEQYLRHQ